MKEKNVLMAVKKKLLIAGHESIKGIVRACRNQ
jgi:hypothetical protein